MVLSELMIGDWYQWYADGKYYYYQVTKETFSESEDTIANFEPIPLMSKVLEKNGFLYNDNYNEWTLTDEHDFDIIVLCEVAKGYTMTTEGVTLSFQYVHQLQHLLRLCGINKEMKL